MLVSVSTVSSKSIHLESETLQPEKNSLDGKKVLNSDKNRKYNLLQFKSSSTKSERQNLSEKGVNFISYIPEDTWLTKVTGRKGEIISDEDVRALIPYKPEYRISPELRRKIQNNSGIVKVRVELFRSVENAESLLENFGNVNSQFSEKTWKLETSYSNISSLSREEPVEWVSEEPPGFETKNNDSRKLLSVNNLQNPPYNLRGQGFTAGIWDGGAVKYHEDLNYTGKTVLGEDNGVNYHAVHVAGTMLGGGKINLGSGIPNRFRGVAYNSSLVSYDFNYADSTELYNEMDESITSYDSILSQNSWGYGIDSSNQELMGDYTGESELYDKIVAGKTTEVSDNIPVIFAAGNEGDKHLFQYNTTTGPGATSKNTITVGSVDENKNLASYSSMGPTDDGRIKPTVVALGGDFSTTGGLFSTIPSTNNAYPYGGIHGTSMAAPAVSGAVILLNQQFNQTYRRLPEPATVKGTLIHTAEDLGRKGPDYKYGWGLVNATKAVEYIKASKHSNLIRRGSISGTGDNETFNFTVPENETVKFTLVWSDHPGSSSLGKTLINDLDLVVKNDNGDRKYPWTINWSDKQQEAEKNIEDHLNPVEQVQINNTNRNNYSITVEGYKVPNGSQSYTLLASSKDILNPSDLMIKSPENSSYSSIPDFNLSSIQELSSGRFSLNGKENHSLKKKNNTFLYNDSAQVEDGSYKARFWGQDKFGDWASREIVFALDTENPLLEVKNPNDGDNISDTFKVEATWRDDTSKVSSKTFSLEGPENINGTLNATLNSSTLEDGNYTLFYRVSDSAGNTAKSNISITLDNTKPLLSAVKPSKEYLSSVQKIEANYSDETTNIANSTYRFENKSVQKKGNLNDSLNTSNLADGNYSITYKATDEAGNTNEDLKQVKIDNTEPDANLTTLSPAETVSDTLWVNATRSDSSPIVSANYTISNSSGEVRFGELNTSIETRNLEDGEYNLSYSIDDRAGNRLNRKIKFYIQNPPEINITTPENKNYSQKPGFNFSSSEHLKKANMELDGVNITLENTSSIEFYNTSINLSQGNHSAKFYASDLSGKTNSKTVNFSFDSKKPSINISLTGEPVYRSWFRDSATVDFTCSDETSRIENKTVKIGGNLTSLNTSKSDYLAMNHGKSNYAFTCTDSAGNMVNNTTNISIDSKAPFLKSSNPADNSKVSKHPSISVYFNNETDESGIDINSSNISTSSGKIENLTWKNSSVNIDMTSLNEGENFQISTNLTDFIGNNEKFNLSFNVKMPSQTSDSSDNENSGNSNSQNIEGISLTESETSNETEENKTDVENSSKKFFEEVKAKKGINKIKNSSKNPVKEIETSAETTLTLSSSEESYEEPENTETYSQIDITKKSPEKIDLNITFSINRSWFESKEIEPRNTALYRRNDSKWQKLETSLVNSSNREYLFKSEVPGFSPFIVAANKNKTQNTSVKTKNISEANKTSNTANKDNIKQENEREIRGKNSSSNLKPAVVIGTTLTLISLPFVIIAGIKFNTRRKILEEIEELKEVSDNPRARSELISAETSINNGDIEKAKEKLYSARRKI